MKTTKILGAVVVAGLALAFASKVQAAQLTNTKLTLGDSGPGVVGTSHTFVFTHPSNSALRQINFLYCKTPSGTCTAPNGLVTAQPGHITDGVYVNLATPANWKVTSSVDGNVVLFDTVGVDTAINSNTVLTIPFTGITNNTIDTGVQSNNCDFQNATLPTDNSSDTCYVRINTYTDAGVTEADKSIVSYTVISRVTVSARVDPTFTFVVQAVPDATVHSNITTTMPSTFGTLPFGNLTAGTPKYTAHALFVTTNTQTGYTVSAKMDTQMVGVYAGNNIDPFTAAWGTPTAWVEPTGNVASVDTAWFGANTTDTTLAGWSTPNGLFGGIGPTNVVVKQKTTSDNGTTPTYLTYALEANVFQPADTYTGTLVYNALPTY
jgi:hypothetical protein